MKLIAAVLSLLVLAACSSRDGTPAISYKNPIDVMVVGLGLEPFLGTSCTRMKSYEDDACYKFGSPRRYQGVWYLFFESSPFYEGVENVPDETELAKFPDIWLDVDARQPLPLREGQQCAARGCVFVVDFVGRENLHEGAFGHMGMSGNQIIVDKMISVRQVTPPD